MANPGSAGTTLVMKNGRRVPATLPANGAPATRMIGWNAGLPMGGLGDKVMKTTGAIPLRGEAPSDFQRTGTTVRIRGWERHPVVQACIRCIVDIASAVPLQVYQKLPAKNATGFSDMIQVDTSDHPLQQLFDAPNSFMSAQRYRGFLMMHYLGYGNAMTFLERPIPGEPGEVTGTPSGNVDINTQLPVSLRLIHPEDVTTVYVNHKGYPLWYLWLDTLGYPHTSPVQDIMHIRDLNMKGLVFGFPRAASALNDIIGDDEASQFVRQIVTNNGQPIGYAIVNEETTMEEAEAAEAKFKEKMVHRGGRGSFVFMGGVTDVKSLAFDLSSLEFPDLRRVAREDICAACGVDPRMVGITTATRDAGLSGTQYIEARVRLIKQTIEPMMRNIESELNHWICPEFGPRTYVRFDPDAIAALAEDKDATSTRVLKELAGGARTVEETREVLELRPEFDPDDLLALGVGISLTPVMIALQPPSPPVQPALDANGTQLTHPDTGAPLALMPPKADPSHLLDLPTDDTTLVPEDAGTVDGEAESPKKKKKTDAGTNTDAQIVDLNNPTQPTGPAMGDGGKTAPPKRAEAVVPLPMSGRILRRGVVLTGDQRTMLWHQFDQRAAREEPGFKRQALLLFGEERSTITDLFQRAEDKSGPDDATKARSVKTQVKRAYKPGGEVQARWQDRFHPLIGNVYGKGADHVLAGLRSRRSEILTARAGTTKDELLPIADMPDISFDFHLSNPAVQQAVQDRAKRLAEQVGGTTADTITEAIDFGLEEGLSIAEIAKLVDQTTFGGMASSRATMIARTETIGSLNQGEFDSAGDSGVIAGKEWLTQGDDRVRDTHYECEAEGMIPIDDAFEINQMMYPGDPDGDAAEVINCRCVAPETRVRGGFIGATRSVYHGRMLTVRTRDGRRLRVTPNHPILTPQGLRAAGTLNVGDELLCDAAIVERGLTTEGFDDHQSPSTAREIFETLVIHHPSRQIQPRGEDFHGDAAGIVGQIDAIFPNHALRRQPVTSGGDGSGDLADVMAGRGEPRMAQLALDHLGAGRAPFEQFGLATSAWNDSALVETQSRNTARDAELGGESLERSTGTMPRAEAVDVDDAEPFLQARGRSDTAALDAVFAKVVRERGIADSRLVREAFLRFTRTIATDEITEIRDDEFRGHVYDLMSESGLMITEGIVASNCSLLYYDTLDAGAQSV